MSRPLTAGEQLLAQAGIKRSWSDDAYPDGRPSVDQAVLGITLPVASELSPGNPWPEHQRAMEGLQALGRLADRVGAGECRDEMTVTSLGLYIGDLLQRMSGVPPSQITPHGEVL